MKIAKKLNKRLLFFSTLLSFLYSTFFIIGEQVETFKAIFISKRVFFNIIGLSFLINIFIILSFCLLDYYLSKSKEKTPKKNIKHPFFLIWIFIFAAWIPIFLACYPGLYHFDVPVQIPQFSTHHYEAFHPMFHSLYLYSTLQLGHICGSDNLGVAIYTTSQMLILSAIFAYTCFYLLKLNIPTLYIIFTTIFYAFFPVNSLLAMCSTKSILYAGVLLLLFLIFLDISLHPNEKWFSKKNTFIFTTVILFNLLFRNKAIYIYILCIPLLLYFQKNDWKKLLLIIFIPLLVYVSCANLLIARFNIKKSKSVELLSIPLHQLGRTFKFNENNISQKDKDLFFKIVEKDSLKYFQHYNVDSFKQLHSNWEVKTFKNEELLNHKLEYFNLWYRLGKKYPNEYINSFLTLTLGYWYPKYKYRAEEHTDNPYIGIYVTGELENYDIYTDSQLPKLKDFLWKLGVKNKYEDYPLISILFSISFYNWLLLYCVFYTIYKKKYQFLFPLSLPIIIFLSNLTGPNVLLRYSYPIIICSPVMIGMFFLIKNTSNSNE